MKQIFKENKIEVAWILYGVFALGLISILWYDFFNCSNKCFNEDTIRDIILNVALITFVILWFSFRKRFLSLFSWKTSKEIDWAVLIGFILALVIIYLCFYHEHNFRVHFYKDNIGGIFVVIMGIVTVLGLYFAIKSISDITSTITSYPQLVSKLIDLIDEAKKNEDEIRIFSYFVFPGYMQIGENLQKRFKKAFKDLKKIQVKIVCANEREHINLLINIALRGTETFEKIKGDDKNTDDVSKRIGDFLDLCENDLLKISKPETIKRLPCDSLPNFYFFVTSERAIFVTPVGLPGINENIDNDDLDKIIEKLKILHKSNKTEKEKNKNEIKELIKSLIIKTYEKDTHDISAYENKKEKLKNAQNETPSEQIETDIERLEFLITKAYQGAKIYTLGVETKDQKIIDVLLKAFNVYFPEN